jgi:hypothetical protein
MPILITNRWTVPPAPNGRDSLTIGSYMPGPENTGVLPNISRTLVSGNVTLSTPQVYADKTVTGRLSITSSGVTVRNVEIQGNATPTSSGVVGCTNAAVSGAVFEDCTIYTVVPHYTWNGVVGHDYTLRRCNVYGTTDLINIYNTNLAPARYATGVVIEGCWLHDPIWWTAETGGIVHPSDTETHNDIIQHYGGYGTIIRGNTIDAAYARQQGHWKTTSPNQPFHTIGLQTLPDGGPYQHIPDRDITNGTINGTLANGRYNWDDTCCLMINNSQGKSNQMTVTDNYFFGGNYCINGGGNPYNNDGYSLGDFLRNQFDRAQGEQGSGGDNTYTLAALGNWAGHINAPTTGLDANVYMDNGHAITVRP